MDFPEQDKPRGEASPCQEQRGKRGAGKRNNKSIEARNVIEHQRAFDRFVVSRRSFSVVVGVEGTFVLPPPPLLLPFSHPVPWSARVKIELRCHCYPSENRSIWKRGETRRRPRIFFRFLSFPSFFLQL